MAFGCFWNDLKAEAVRLQLLELGAPPHQHLQELLEYLGHDAAWPYRLKTCESPRFLIFDIAARRGFGARSVAFVAISAGFGARTR